MKRNVNDRLLDVVPSIVIHRDELVSTNLYRRLRSRGHARFSRDFRSFAKALSLISFLPYLYIYIYFLSSLVYLFFSKLSLPRRPDVPERGHAAE